MKYNPAIILPFDSINDENFAFYIDVFFPKLKYYWAENLMATSNWLNLIFIFQYTKFFLERKLGMKVVNDMLPRELICFMIANRKIIENYFDFKEL